MMRLPNWMLIFSLLLLGFAQYSANAAFAAHTANTADANYAPVFTGDATQLRSQKESNTLININQANAQELASLPGLGAKKALAIIEYRELNGNFKSVDELVNVRGIGPKMMAKLLPFVVV